MDAGTAAAEALRESFGDRRPPDISRKITACVACRKQKIKCHMADDQPPCTRCKKRGLPCTVNRSLQMLLEGDVAWKATVEDKLRMLEESIQQLHSRRPDGSHATPSHVRSQTRDSPASQSGPAPPATSTVTPTQANDQGWEVVMDLNRGPGVVPASVVSEVSDSSPAACRPHAADDVDLIDQGVVSLQDAESWFALYHHRLDHFVYRILDEHDSLASVRKSSPLLTAAICAVAALHTPSHQYQAGYQHFVQLAAQKTFAKRHSHDDIRALCIGAFWLSDISWTLVGMAARLAGELNLHRCIPKVPHTKKACYLRTRLYYLVFVCDHHFSVAYGRPPLTRDFSAITAPAEFLKSEFATEDDARLVSQVELWITNTRIFDQFSLDPEAHLSPTLIPQLRRLGIALDTWRADWNEQFQANARVGNYPRKGVGLHYHFSKLYLCSHVFRRAPSLEPVRFEPDLEEYAQGALQSAMAILQVIVADEEIQSYLHGLPAYFDTMIAFAFVFLLKIAVKNPTIVRIDQREVVDLLDRLVIVLQGTTSSMHPRHLLTSIAASMRKLLDRFLPAPPPVNVGPAMQPLAPPALSDPVDLTSQWLSQDDAIFMEHYDFLYSPTADFGLGVDFGTMETH